MMEEMMTEEMMAPNPERTVAWTSLFWPGADFCTVSRIKQGWLLAGTAIGVLQKQPMRAEYEVICNAAWQTRRVRVQQRLGRRRQVLILRVDRSLRWWQGNRPLLRLRGCQDVDLMVTPITNTLPIRRLQLKIGQSAEVTAAWVRFPELRLEPLSQRYTRLARDRYRYQSATGFSAELVVDDFGLVTLYPGGWQRVAAR